MKNKRVKRMLDIITSGALIVLFFPLIVLTAISIKLFSQGPILYHCRRLGIGGKNFHYFKFRSMVPGTKEITGIGRFIRCWHFDELPELFLVLIGHMSLVGPRAIRYETALKENLDYYWPLPIRPGITGLSQTKGGRYLPAEDRKKIDLQYIQKWNLQNDFLIILKTPLAIISQRHKTLH